MCIHMWDSVATLISRGSLSRPNSLGEVLLVLQAAYSEPTGTVSGVSLRWITRSAPLSMKQTSSSQACNYIALVLDTASA